MKKIILINTLFCVFIARGQVGIGVDSPDLSSAVHMSSDNKGFTFPHVMLTSINSSSPVTDPVDGLLVFNTTIDSSNDLYEGLYIWDVSKGGWEYLVNNKTFNDVLSKYNIETGYLVANSNISQAIAFSLNAATFYQLSFDNIDFDRVSSFDSSVNTYTIPETGSYTVRCGMEINNSITGTITQVQLRKNGTVFKTNSFEQGNIPVSASYYLSPSVSYTGQLIQGDKITCFGSISAKNGSTRFKYLKVTRF